MYSFTKQEKLPFVTVQCECGRRFIPEEMYCCLNCSSAFCRFCTTQELFCYYCRHCGDNYFPNDLIQVKTFCQACFECPNCKHVLQLLLDKQQRYFFQCQYCFWNSKTLGIQDFKSDQVYNKISQEQKKQNESLLTEFNDKTLKWKERDQEIMKKKQTMKAKKQFKTSFGSRSGEKIKRYTNQEIEQMNKEKEQKYIQMKYNLDVSEIKQKQIPEFNLMKELSSFDKQVFKRLDNYSKLPNQLNLLIKKNRNCRQCGKIILKLEKQKDNKFIPNLSQFFCEYSPTFIIRKVKKSEENLIVDLNIINKTKTQLKIIVKQLTKAQTEKHNLSEVLQFPEIKLVLPSQELDTQTQSQQLFYYSKMPENYYQFIVEGKFGFIVDVALEAEKASLSYLQVIQL